ncbi:thioredoxin family protein [Marinoscillum sp.]|uniref:thioredoxin family protein n=1 Tax=Marinoscillum sp. TaxID=2024838 RepID=UPI003BA84A86
MSKLTYLTFILLMISQSLLAQNQSKGIVFDEMQWEEAMKKATEQQKLVFVVGYVEWSEPCADLAEYTLTDQEVGEFYNANFINLQVDMEDYLGLTLTDTYDVESYPVFLFLDGSGNMVHRGCGAIDSNDFIQMGKEAIGENPISVMQQKFDAGERSLDFLIEYSLTLEDACMDNTDFVNDYFAGTNQHDWMNEASWAMINLNVTDPYSEQFQYLIAYHDMFSLKYGKDTVDAKVFNVMLDQLIAIYEGSDLTLFATQALRQLMAEVDFKDKEQLMSLANLKVNDLKENWPTYAEYAIQVVGEQDVRDPDQLNEFGWKFYLFVEKAEHLEAAAAWMREVLRDYPDATYYDTYASLKYKLGAVKEAIKYGELAMQAAEIEGEDLMHYKTQLDLFKSGK